MVNSLKFSYENLNMRIHLFVIMLLLLLFQPLYSQEGDHYKYLQKQRMYPIDSIKSDAYTIASEQQSANNSMFGYYINDPWVSIGPSIAGSGAGRVTSVKYDPDYDPINRPYIYCTGHNGGVWKSSNSGTTFIPITESLPTQSSGVICLDPNNPDIIYYATGGSVEAFSYNYYGFGVFKSTDRGVSWTGGNNVHYPKVTYSYGMEVNPSNSNILYLAEYNGFYISSDAGSTWNAPFGNNSCQDVSVSADGRIVCAIGGLNGMFWPPFKDGLGYYRSSDYGNTFTQMTNYGFTPAQRTHISVSADGNYVYALTYSDNMYVYSSTDGGVNFSRSQNLGSTYGLMGKDFMFVEASPHNPQTAILGYGTGWVGLILWITTNGGSTWTSMSAPGGDVNCLTFNPNPTYSQEVLCGYDQGLSKSTDLGSSWPYSLNSTLMLTENYRISSYYDANVNLIMGAVTDAGFTRSTDGGASWNAVNFGCDGTNVVISQHDPNIWYEKRVVASKGACSYFLYSNDGGAYFGSSDLTGKHDWIAAYQEDPHLAGIFFCPTLGTGLDNGKTFINVSTNYGLNWARARSNNLFSYVPTINPCQQPQTFTMSSADTNLLFFSSNDYYPEEIGCQREGQMLWRSLNAGVDWDPIDRLAGGLTDRFITSVVADPVNADVVYITVSGLGYNTGHVFKSIDKGINWYDISGTGNDRLPDIPVNCLEIRSINDVVKELIIGTDNGVYVSLDNDVSVPAPVIWKEYASGLPRTIVLDIEINNALGKIRCAAFGRSIFEANLSGPWVITGAQNIIKGASELNINQDVIVESNGILEIPKGCTIKMKEGTKILVESGGQILASSGGSVTFTSQSGTWEGIELQGECSATLKNCTFANTSSPIVINGSFFPSTVPPDILVDSCNFNAPIEVNNRSDVTIEYCNFSYTSGIIPSVMGVICSGSDNAFITNNTINANSSISSIGISVIYGSDVIIQKNSINNMSVGISISNTSPFVSQNRITNGTPSTAIVGIGFDNSYSASVKQNTVIGYQAGYKLYNSSPEMYSDSSYNTNTAGDSVNSLHAVYYSSPRLKPTESDDQIIWDAGKNSLKTINKGNGIYMFMSSVPITDFGYNFIWGYDNYLFGDGPDERYYYARCNDWVDDPPVSNKFNLTNPSSTIYNPYGCTPPGGSGRSSIDDPVYAEKGNVIFDESTNPPNFIVVNYGHGIFDTLKITSGSNSATLDQQIYGEGVKNELMGYHDIAISKFKTVIESYHDSLITKNALKKLLNCYVKKNADSSEFNNLRSYYLTLIQQHLSDTHFVKVAKELAAKTLVNKGEYGNAITEYEYNISTSNDSYEVLCNELNIIETYLIMMDHGDAPSFTGRLTSLKPFSKRDGYMKLMERLYGIQSSQGNNALPDRFNLSQNYPNPFNPITRINYSIPNSINVSLKVYDILGRLVKTLVNEYRDAGSYSVTFDGSSLSSGVYFYRIEAGNFVVSKKMVLVK